jgi:hypothetical protein
LYILDYRLATSETSITFRHVTSLGSTNSLHITKAEPPSQLSSDVGAVSTRRPLEIQNELVHLFACQRPVPYQCPKSKGDQPRG